MVDLVMRVGGVDGEESRIRIYFVRKGVIVNKMKNNKNTNKLNKK